MRGAPGMAMGAGRFSSLAQGGITSATCGLQRGTTWPRWAEASCGPGILERALQQIGNAKGRGPVSRTYQPSLYVRRLQATQGVKGVFDAVGRYERVKPSGQHGDRAPTATGTGTHFDRQEQEKGALRRPRLQGGGPPPADGAFPGR